MNFKPTALVKTYQSNVIDIYLDDEITSPSDYREVYHALSNAGPQDLVKIHINSPGGRLDSGIQIINHIRHCEALVVGVLHMDCASMASGIFLACHDWEINKFSTMMVHSCSYGAGGKQSDIKNRVNFMTDFNEKFIREIYTGFLTEEEIDLILKGDDIYFSAEEIDKKLEQFKQYRESLKNSESTSELKEEEEIVIKAKPARKRTSKSEKQA
jgi:ATP-dependent protease ClpP protease subunit